MRHSWRPDNAALPRVLRSWIWRTARLPNCRWVLGSLWDVPLAEYDVAYAFLSPEPMRRLWLKVKREMRPGAWFISNSFRVPDVEATAEIDVDDARKTRLYCYRL